MYRDNLIELNERINAAKEAIAQRENLKQKLAAATEQKGELTERVADLADALAKEQKDVAKLEGTSVRGIFVSIFGNKQQRLEKERQEVEAATSKHCEAAAELAALERDIAAMTQAIGQLAGADQAYEAAMTEKANWLAQSETPAAKDLAQLWDRVNGLRTVVRELEQAKQAGDVARIELETVQGNLNKASGWGTFDILGGGMLSSMAKHDYIDQAKAHAQNAQLALEAFSRELKDVNIDSQIVVDIGGFSKFADMFFDNIISDVMVQSKIRKSLERTNQWLAQVAALMNDLDARYQANSTELQRLEARRRDLVEKW